MADFDGGEKKKNLSFSFEIIDFNARSNRLEQFPSFFTFSMDIKFMVDNLVGSLMVISFLLLCSLYANVSFWLNI